VSDGLFRRVAVAAHSAAGDVPCWIYVAGPGLAPRLTESARIEAGGPAR
jgi:hypothetical protein